METESIKERFEPGRFGVSLHRFAAVALVIVCASSASRILADDNVMPVNGWKVNRDPFSNNASSSITGYADLGSERGHANVTIECQYDGTPAFTVGIANGQLDITTKQEFERGQVGWKDFGAVYGDIPVTKRYLPIDFKLGENDADHLECSADNPNAVSFSCYTAKLFLKEADFLIRVPIAGEKIVLSIPLKDSTVSSFLSHCEQVANSQESRESQSETSTTPEDTQEKAATTHERIVALLDEGMQDEINHNYAAALQCYQQALALGDKSAAGQIARIHAIMGHR